MEIINASRLPGVMRIVVSSHGRSKRHRLISGTLETGAPMRRLSRADLSKRA